MSILGLDGLNSLIMVVGLAVNAVVWPSILWLLRHEPQP